jgi:peptidoglycan/xylan/chitin deacetylase (PgdA/CDA1 family)
VPQRRMRKGFTRAARSAKGDVEMAAIKFRLFPHSPRETKGHKGPATILMSTRSHDRYPYSPITARPVYDWPGGKRLAVYVGLNLEWFSFGEGLGAELAPGGPQPDVLNYAWRDYGNRVGVFRLAGLFDELKLPVSLLINSEMYRHAPAAVAAFPNAELVGHGRSNSERQGDLEEKMERLLIEETTAAIEQHSGKRPRGWLGPWISQSPVTPDLLQEAGYRYLLDWCHDDQPVWMKTRRGRILSVPYPQELNDIPQIVSRKREGAEFADMIVDAFEVMHEECVRRPLVMGIALHPYIVGWPHRFKHLARALRHISRRTDDRVWFTTSGEIADFAERLPAGTVP